jgi:hypothetical protein
VHVSEISDPCSSLFVGGVIKNLTVAVGEVGTPERPYLISSRADMEALSKNVNASHNYTDTCFLLTRDLTGAEDIVTTVIGNTINSQEFESSISDNDFESRYFAGLFAGLFDGGGHEITANIKVSEEENYMGIFGVVKGATIKNLNVSGEISGIYCAGSICGFSIGGTRIISCSNQATVTGRVYSGGICGYIGAMYSISEIIGCHNSGEIVVNGKYGGSASGGIIGCAGGNCEITDCHNEGEIVIKGDRAVYAGGITGDFYLGRSNTGIRRCSNRGETVATGKFQANAGGIVGRLNMGEISNCYNRGKISAKVSSGITLNSYSLSHSFCSGGIVGYSGGGSCGIINCYNTGDIMSSEQTGGICGYLSGVIKNCFAANARASAGHKPERRFQSGPRPGRIMGMFGAEGDEIDRIENSYALSSMTINGRSCDCRSSTSDERHGQAASSSNFKDQSWLESKLGWDFSIWVVSGNDYPVLRSEVAH